MLKIILAAASLHAASAKPAPLTAIEVYESVLKAQKKQASIEGSIVREVLKGKDAAERVTGTLKTYAGGKAWLEMTVPSRQLAVCDGKSLYVELGDVKQVMKYDAAQLKKGGNFFLDLGSSIRFYAANSLKRLIMVGEGFDEAKHFALELLPLNKAEAGFERMRVWVDKDGWLIRQVELKVSGQTTRVRFEKLRVVTRKEEEKGARTPDLELFKYKPPKGYELFDMASMQ